MLLFMFMLNRSRISQYQSFFKLASVNLQHVPIIFSALFTFSTDNLHSVCILLSPSHFSKDSLFLLVENII